MNKKKWVVRGVVALGLTAIALYFGVPLILDRTVEHVASREPSITVFNGSPQTIRNIVVSGRGFSFRLNELAPNQKHSASVSVRGESGLAIEFEGPNGKISKSDLAYLEGGGGYYAELTIDKNYAIHCNSGIGKLY